MIAATMLCATSVQAQTTNTTSRPGSVVLVVGTGTGVWADVDKAPPGAGADDGVSVTVGRPSPVLQCMFHKE
ncbi:hypothetical protein KCMC57_up60710 [Kitasatospora sp. CMC57]|uniref:Uncharacterized protein n=1 Tax=Kitasatospora sp. CMC57 TaxID=3231513 RepID=A0AB33K7M5_9ACTN